MRLNPSTLIIAWVFMSCQSCAAQPATAPSLLLTPPSPVAYTHDVRQDPPLHIHVVTIDLTDPRVHVAVSRGGPDPDGPGPWQTTMQTVRSIAQRERYAVAVNGDFFMNKDTMHLPGQNIPYFNGNWARVCGWAMSDGVLWSDRSGPVSLIVDAAGHVSISRIAAGPPVSARQIVSGGGFLVENGKNVAQKDARALRTAAGLNAEGTRLILHVVDGRRPDYSVGMTLQEQADELIKLGCQTAMQLDGGGSSTLVMRNPANDSYDVINRPSDGHQLLIPISVERAVASALGIRIDSAPTTAPAQK